MNDNTLVQISISCYPSSANVMEGGYIYSKPMTKKEAERLIKEINCGKGSSDNGLFFRMEKKEGIIYIRPYDIKSILIKEADTNYI